MKKVIFAFFSVLLLANVCCFADSKENSTEEFSKVRLVCFKDFVLWIGLGAPLEFDSSCLDEKEKELVLEKGLATCEELAKQGQVVFQSELAKYYYYTPVNKNNKRALYWARKVADQGVAGGGMVLLHNAYTHGDGVVRDLEEGLKWGFLAAAMGNKQCKEKMEGLARQAVNSEYLKPLVDEAKRRANQWMKEHEELFFNPD